MVMDKRLVIFEHSKTGQTVYIVFAEFKDGKIIGQEEAIFEEKEIYKILKKWLVKFRR